MKLKDKENILIDVLEAIKLEILAKLHNTPDEWDRREIVWLIKDHLDKYDILGDDKRFDDYDNFVIVNNLV